MKLIFKIMSVYTGKQMIKLLYELNIDYQYTSLKEYSLYTIDTYKHTNQVLKLGRYGGSLKKL